MSDLLRVIYALAQAHKYNYDRNIALYKHGLSLSSITDTLQLSSSPTAHYHTTIRKQTKESAGSVLDATIRLSNAEKSEEYNMNGIFQEYRTIHIDDVDANGNLVKVVNKVTISDCEFLFYLEINNYTKATRRIVCTSKSCCIDVVTHTDITLTINDEFKYKLKKE